MVLATDDIDRERLIAPVGFDPDGSHDGLIWTGQTELSGKAHDLACSLAGSRMQDFVWLSRYAVDVGKSHVR
jgi:hypothetical protein